MILTTDQLNTECKTIIDSLASNGYKRFEDVLYMLFQYGFRANEVYRWRFWTIQPNNLISFPPSKGCNPRVIPLDELPINIQSTITTSQLHFYLPKYDSLIYNFKQFTEHTYRAGDKNISTHIFRHNRIKQMNETGYSIAQIKAFTGLKKDQTVRGYINSTITKLS